MGGEASRFHFLRIVSHSVKVDYLICMAALLFLGAALETLRGYADRLAYARGDYINSWETFLPLYYFLFVLLCLASHLVMEWETARRFFEILPMTRRRQAVVRMAEPGVVTFIWFFLPFSMFLQIADPEAPHVYYLFLLWILARSLAGFADGFDSFLSRIGPLGWGAWLGIHVLAGACTIPFTVIPFYLREVHPGVFDEWVLRPNLVAAGSVFLLAILGVLCVLASVAWAPWPQSLRSESETPEPSNFLNTLDLAGSGRGSVKWAPYLLPALFVFLFFPWTVLYFLTLEIYQNFLVWTYQLLGPQMGDRLIGTRVVVGSLGVIPIFLLYASAAAALSLGALSIIPFIHHWQTLPSKTCKPFAALTLFGSAFALGMWFLFDWRTEGFRPADLLNRFLLTGCIFPPFALVGLLLANPLHWGREPGGISDPVGIVVIGVSLILMGTLLSVFDRLLDGALAPAWLLIPVAYNLAAMAWMYRRY